MNKILNKKMFDGVDIEVLANKENAAFYIYSENKIKESYDRLRSALPDNMRVFYSMKANSNIAVVDILYKLGAGIEIASIGELLACQKIGVKPEDIVFAGPAKTDEELRAAIEYDIHLINAESFNELKRIDSIAKDLNKMQKVNLRVNPDTEIEGAVTMGGGSKKFGVDQEKIAGVKDVIKELDNIEMKGIHVFSATQLFEQEKVLENIELALKIAKEHQDVFNIDIIDIGTGFGIPYSKNEEEMDLNGMQEKIAELVSKYELEDKEFVMESGRFLVGLSGAYISQVIDIKESRGKNYVLIKGGINHFLRPALIGDNHEVFNISSNKPKEKVDIGGQLCTSLDFVAKDVEMNQSTIGNNICFLQAGAYGYSESMPFFLSHVTPREYLIKDSEVFLIRESFEIKDLIEKQHLPKTL